MEQKLPYYMAYPMTLDFEDDKAERMDFEYLKSMYPEAAKKLLPYVEEECDRMSYENSMIYDQYPDRLQLRLMCSRICSNVRKYEKALCAEGLTDLVENGRRGGRKSGAGESKNPTAGEDRIRDLVEVMLYQEIFRRRREHRRTARRFY